MREMREIKRDDERETSTYHTAQSVALHMSPSTTRFTIQQIGDKKHTFQKHPFFDPWRWSPEDSPGIHPKLP